MSAPGLSSLSLSLILALALVLLFAPSPVAVPLLPLHRLSSSSSAGSAFATFAIAHKHGSISGRDRGSGRGRDIRNRKPARNHNHASLSRALRCRAGALTATTTAVDLASKPEAVKEDAEGEGASIVSSIFNLTKSIIGAGVLSLPAGVAAFSDVALGLTPAILMAAALGLASAYCFSLIGRLCAIYNATTIKEAWTNVIGDKTAWLPAAAATFKCFAACLAYSIIIGDSFAALATTAGAPALLTNRGNLILLISSTVLYPLCSLKSLKSLKITSILGLLGTLYTASFMLLRLSDGTYAPAGKFYKTISANKLPLFGKRGVVLNHMVFLLLSMLSTAYIAHYNAPKFYTELKNKSVSRFNSVVWPAFGVSMLTFILMTAFGFLTFGGNCQGFILNNYSTQDTLATIARFAIGSSIVFGYPLTFVALRDGVFDLVKVPKEQRTKFSMSFTLGLLSIITLLALVLDNVGFVVSLSGALLGSAIIYIFPNLMNIFHLTNKSKVVSLATQEKLELGLNYGLTGTGLVLGLLGVVVTILKTFTTLI